LQAVPVPVAPSPRRRFTISVPRTGERFLIDAFFVFSGKLFVRGRMPQRNAVEAYSYCPLTNLWEQDDWMLRVLGSARPRPFYGSGPERGSNSVHIFDTLTKKWTLGANMLSRRGEFAWGFIGNRLYVAGGYGGADVGIIAAAEVYDFGTNEWREVSSMPAAMVIDVFFAVSGKLFVGGWMPPWYTVEAYSYCPLTNVWEQDDGMLRVLGWTIGRVLYIILLSCAMKMTCIW
jgi:hypothetical protein